VSRGSAHSSTLLRAPFPWFGGKSRAAPLIWQHLGNVKNYVEPFAGSLAVLLQRPEDGHTETVNDRDCFLANFWRALSEDPAGVARWASSPVNEADLHARHRWLVRQDEFRERMKTDPDFFDVKIAGWWVWGQCAWIGTGWCHAAEHRKFPHLGNAGQGINRQLPHLGNAGRGIESYFYALAQRLRRVRVACGDWRRVLTPSVTVRHGLTGVVLDPPYAEGDMDYAAGGTGTGISAAVREWALANGDDPQMRIALCGLEGEHKMPRRWCCVPWKARGGYGSQRRGGGNDNAARERIWFSPHCHDDSARAAAEAHP
jgi:hypothetical protein